MRKIHAEVLVEERQNGLALLRIRAATGEEIGVELTADKRAALRDALAGPQAEQPADAAPKAKKGRA